MLGRYGGRVDFAPDVTPFRDGGLIAWLGGQVHNAAAVCGELGLSDSAEAAAVAAAAYARWGTSLPARLRGEFVLVVCDERTGEGLIACDHLGGRSLYYGSGASGELIFATEIAPLLGAFERRPAPDSGAVACWLAQDGLPGERTLYEGVSRLAAGHCLQLAGGAWVRRRFWEPRYQPPLEADRGDLVDLVRATLLTAVEVRLPPRRPAGVLLSGGLDSASVAAAGRATQSPEAPVRAYSATFPSHPQADESQLIEHFTETVGMPSVRQRVWGGSALAGTLEFQRLWEVPLVAPNEFFWQPLLRRAATDGVGSILDGEGGDELFGLSPYLLSDALARGRVGKALSLARSTPTVWQGRRTGLRQLWGRGVPGALPYGVHRLGRRRSTPTWLNPASSRLHTALSDEWGWKRLDGPRWWRYLSSALTEGRERMGVFEQLRRRAAGAGLEARSPLLGLELVELALRIPPETAYDPLVTRPLLREAVQGLVPDAIRLRPWKSHFTTILHEALTGPDLGLAQHLLGGRDAEVFAYLDADVVREQVLNPPSGPALFPWAMNVWRAASAECWLRQQSDPDAPAKLAERWRLPAPQCDIESARGAASGGTFFRLDRAPGTTTVNLANGLERR